MLVNVGVDRQHTKFGNINDEPKHDECRHLIRLSLEEDRKEAILDEEFRRHCRRLKQGNPFRCIHHLAFHLSSGDTGVKSKAKKESKKIESEENTDKKDLKMNSNIAGMKILNLIEHIMRNQDDCMECFGISELSKRNVNKQYKQIMLKIHPDKNETIYKERCTDACNIIGKMKSRLLKQVEKERPPGVSSRSHKASKKRREDQDCPSTNIRHERTKKVKKSKKQKNTSKEYC